MSIIDKVKNVFKGKKEDNYEGALEVKLPLTPLKHKSPESFIYSNILWYNYLGMTILISFTEDAYYAVLEFIDTCNKASIYTCVKKTTYDEEIPDPKNPEVTKTITHDRNYLLISGELDDYANLYKVTENLANEVLACITTDIYSRCGYDTFYTLIEDGILDKGLFLSYEDKAEKPDSGLTAFCTNSRINSTAEADFIDARVILKKLPSVFVTRDIVPCINYYVEQSGTGLSDYTSNLFLAIEASAESDRELKELDDEWRAYLNILLGEDHTIDNLRNLVCPYYLFDLGEEPEEDDDGIGSLSDSEVDDFFKQKYDRFNAVVDNRTEYTDIDEELASDAESENMREEDVL